MDFNEHGIRKAAILVDSLDQATADDLLEQMGSEAARLVRQAMVDLGDVDPAEQRRVIDEFIRVEPMLSASEPEGIDLEKRNNHNQAHRLQPVGPPDIRNSQPSTLNRPPSPPRNPSASCAMPRPPK